MICHPPLARCHMVDTSFLSFFFFHAFTCKTHKRQTVRPWRSIGQLFSCRFGHLRSRYFQLLLINTPYVSLKRSRRFTLRGLLASNHHQRQSASKTCYPRVHRTENRRKKVAQFVDRYWQSRRQIPNGSNVGAGMDSSTPQETILQSSSGQYQSGSNY